MSHYRFSRVVPRLVLAVPAVLAASAATAAMPPGTLAGFADAAGRSIAAIRVSGFDARPAQAAAGAIQAVGRMRVYGAGPNRSAGGRWAP